MSMMRWNPARELGWLTSFDDFFAPFLLRGNGKTVFSPAMDVLEGEDAYTVRVEVPGVAKDEIKLSIEDEVLTISGDRREEQANLLIRERRYGAFERRLKLPEGIDLEKVDARHEDGVLTIELPKKEEAKLLRREILVN